MGIRVETVDERDSGWEQHHPRFRVYLQSGLDAPDGERTGGTTSTHDLTGVDLLQVVDWAQRQAGGSMTYAIALVHDDPAAGRGLVWLVGMDGNDMTDDEHEVDLQRRMLARRTTVIGIPPADRMPT